MTLFYNKFQNQIAILLILFFFSKIASVVLGPLHFHVNFQGWLVNLCGKSCLDSDRDCSESIDLFGKESYILVNSCAIFHCLPGQVLLFLPVCALHQIPRDSVKSEWLPASQWVGSRGWGAHPGPISKGKVLLG